MAAWIKMVLAMEVGLGPGDFVFDGDLAPLPKRGRNPHPNCWPICIVAKWLDGSRFKIALGVEVGLDPSDIVLDGDRAPPPQKGEGEPPPIFGPYLLWPNGCMDQDETWHAGRCR